MVVLDSHSVACNHHKGCQLKTWEKVTTAPRSSEYRRKYCSVPTGETRLDNKTWNKHQRGSIKSKHKAHTEKREKKLIKPTAQPSLQVILQSLLKKSTTLLSAVLNFWFRAVTAFLTFDSPPLLTFHRCRETFQWKNKTVNRRFRSANEIESETDLIARN